MHVKIIITTRRRKWWPFAVQVVDIATFSLTEIQRSMLIEAITYATMDYQRVHHVHNATWGGPIEWE